jgi:hypothetical protein
VLTTEAYVQTLKALQSLAAFSLPQTVIVLSYCLQQLYVASKDSPFLLLVISFHTFIMLDLSAEVI